MESVLGVVTAVTSAIIGAVVSVVVVVDSSFSLQEIMMRLKRRRESGMGICLTSLANP